MPRTEFATRELTSRRQRPHFSATLVRQLAALANDVRSELNVTDRVLDSLAGQLQRDVSRSEAVDALAQAIVCGSVIAGRFADDWHHCHDFLAEQSVPWEQAILDRISPAPIESSAGFSELTHLYEHLLRHEQPDRRKLSGVFFTPQPIVRYMLGQIDSQLRDEFGLPRGLADDATWGQLKQREPSLKLPRGAGDDERFVRLFDPAVGTGAFLLGAIDFLHARLTDAWRQAGLDHGEIAGRWNEYVPRHLLPRLWGVELLPAPCFLARLHVALKLAQTGYRFGDPARIEIHLGNTLAGPTPPLWCTRSASARPLAERADHNEVAYDIPFTVVLGNPPFSYLSENQSDWITNLVRGDNSHAGYLHADGQTLGEKKTWLHDDYVKFIRYAQWRIETTGCGIAALVTNHGYLSNATFRLMRRQLLRAFPRISVVDLHGNRKAREVTPDGIRDENVFGLDQGIAIGFFRRPPGDVSPDVEHAELWGSRAEKFERLSVGQVSNLSKKESGQVENLSYVPVAPDYRFVPPGGEVASEYVAAPSLTELFPLHATAPVTARDHFVVAFTRGELKQRIEAFRDLSIPDDEIRRRYFTRTRSPRYQLGDTRGWKLTQARRTLAELPEWEDFIQPCQYRPLDWRWVFWHPAMIDWPRHEVTSHFVGPKSKVPSPKSQAISDFGLWTLDFGLALIARRQLPPSEPCNYFWATSALTLDGVIRNDNRGSESLFPVTAETLDAACHAYAIFHSPTYRQRYAAELRRSFPRVLDPQNKEVTAALTRLGRRLIELHTQRPPDDQSVASQRLLVTVAPRFPRFESGCIWIRDDYAIAAAEETTWQFRVGAHQVARKWLADRRSRALHESDIAWFAVILATIRQTRALMDEIDALIVSHGGFPAAFP